MSAPDVSGATGDEGRTMVIRRSSTKNGGRENIYHHDPSCNAVQLIENPLTTPLSALDDNFRPCQYCQGTADLANRGPHGQWSEITCISCGADKSPGGECEWCQRYDEIMGVYA